MMSRLYDKKAVSQIIPNDDTYFVLVSSRLSRIRCLTCYDVLNACNRVLDSYKIVKIMVNNINKLNS